MAIPRVVAYARRRGAIITITLSVNLGIAQPESFALTERKCVVEPITIS